VNQASDGSSALELLRAHKYQIDVLLLDVTLPGLSSREVLLQAQRLRPELQVILTSAYGQETIAALFGGLKFAQFIRKPFAIDDLVSLLQHP
jgi:DNA-binding NtrC family response regulator